jgi:glycosyltransferase involved in cell wall biosynthesis
VQRVPIVHTASRIKMSLPLSIALALESDAPGGAETMLLLLADELLARGHSICPVGPAGRSGWLGKQFRERGLQPETYELRGMIDPGCVLQLAEIFSRRRVDLVHSHEFTMAFYCAVACRLKRIPHVVTMHSAHDSTGAWRRRAALRWAFRNSSEFVAVSRATEAALTERLGLPPGSIGVVHNGVPPKKGTREILRNELGLGDTEVLIVSVGNLYPVKGHLHLLRALGRIQARLPGARWRLAIAGKVSLAGDVQEEGSALRALAEEGGFADRFHLLGFRKDIGNVLAAADLFAMPSLSEGLPLALLEAMHAGLPVIASGVGGIPEVICNPKEGVLVPPADDAVLADALERLILSSSERKALGQAAMRRAQEAFGADVMADRYEALFRSAQGNRSREGGA